MQQHPDGEQKIAIIPAALLKSLISLHLCLLLYDMQQNAVE